MSEKHETQPIYAVFNDLCLGARFRYDRRRYPTAEQVWVKISYNTIAKWDPDQLDTNWIGQQVCSFADTDDQMGHEVEIVDLFANAPDVLAERDRLKRLCEKLADASKELLVVCDRCVDQGEAAVGWSSDEKILTQEEAQSAIDAYEAEQSP